MFRLDSVEEEEAESFGVKPLRRRRNRGPVVQRKAQDTHTSVRKEHTKESDTHVLFHPDLYLLYTFIHVTLEYVAVYAS